MRGGDFWFLTAVCVYLHTSLTSTLLILLLVLLSSMRLLRYSSSLFVPALTISLWLLLQKKGLLNLCLL